MLEYFQKLFLGHVHHWKIIDAVDVGDGCNFRIGSKYILQCEHCGTIKVKRTY